MKILVPVDGSPHSITAVKHLIEHAGWFRDAPVVDLVCVQPPLPTRLVHKALTAEELERHYQGAGDGALAVAKAALEAAGIAYSTHILVGDAAESIVAQSRTLGAEMILMATHGNGDAGGPALGSTAIKILHLSTRVPVLAVH